ncbi:MAG: SRPBCC family protein [Cyanobacteria bacterium P01_F01_bin.150]
MNHRDSASFDTESVPMPIQNSTGRASAGTEYDAIEVQTEKGGGRQRKITATIHIPHTLENVWAILTDYEGLADFIPSLHESRRISHPNDGIRIEQIGNESLLKLRFCARVVLDMFEQFPHQLRFEMVEGDFKQFSGSWQLQACEGGTNLTYTVDIVPSRLMPVAMIERCLSKGLQINLASIKQQANVLFG